MFPCNRRSEDDHEEFKQQIMKSVDSNSLKFDMPPLGINPKEFVKTHFGPGAKNFQFAKGTTTLAFLYEPKTENDVGGVVIAVDSRASSGEYISSKTVMKIIPINDHMVATMAGGAADCQFWTRIVAKYCNLFELREKSEISVRAASKYMANVLYQYRGHGLAVYSMVCGVDKRGPAIFQVDSDGTRLPTRVCSVGSGSLNAYGIMDTYYKPKMTDEEALSLGRRAIMHATYRDAGSGGNCNVVHITPKGKTVYPSMDVSEMYYKFAEEIGRDIAFEPKNDQ
ncbi:proteasome subunit domain-containing protein [Ditylenchus destructor]|uniref:proteasome endopeptidase complex n=1 Tax=Ditylenchus destructor TaxID=166010 RepID=A0AAD4MY13_9BILA|nr:proteasome subunit domain-containing protein [Ditylenchus destructor]